LGTTPGFPDLVEVGPVVVAPLASLAGTRLAYIERGSRVKKSYDHFSPSVNGLFKIRPNLIARASYGRSFNRPDFGNITLQRRVGSQRASFGGFVGKTFNWGVTFSRERFTARLAVNHRGRIQQGTVTNAGTEPNTFTYLESRAIADVAAEYRLTRKLSVFVTGRNVNSANEDTVTYGPSTPKDRIIRGRINYGATWYVGAKATF
jgi:outer membrane receptor protein involved in Fe transport